MIRATELSGRPVVDIDTAEKLGRIEKIIIDPQRRRVAAFLVAAGGTFQRDKVRSWIPAASVHAIGPDAVTTRHVDDGRAAADFDQLPPVSDIVGRKVVSRDGRLLGIVDDVLISGADGVVVGYRLADASLLGSLFGGRKQARAPYLRADVDLRTGRHLIVAPDDALREWDEASESTPPQAGEIVQNRTSGATDRQDNFFRPGHPEQGVAQPLP